ncbi:MAG: Protein smg5, partial [Marteilia pararefringens]
MDDRVESCQNSTQQPPRSVTNGTVAAGNEHADRKGPPIDHSNLDFSDQQFSLERMQQYSVEIKNTWKSSPHDLLNDENIEKIFYFPRFFMYRCYNEELSSNHIQIIDISWKNFIYPVIKIFKVQTSSNGVISELPKMNFKRFLESLLEILIESFSKIKSSESSAIQKHLAYKVALIIGDVKKYMMQEDPAIEPEEAEKYFLSAIIESSSEGIPFNQAGILFQSTDAIRSLLYFYLATLCPEPFNAAEANASHILDCMRERFFGHIKKKSIIK